MTNFRKSTKNIYFKEKNSYHSNVMIKLQLSFFLIFIFWTHSWAIWSPTSMASFMVSINVNNTHRCAGTLITELWVITAANCVTRKKRKLLPKSQLSIIIGLVSYKDEDVQPFENKTVVHIYLHRNFKGGDLRSKNIAMLQLKSPVRVSNHTGLVDLPSRIMTSNHLQYSLNATNCQHYNWQFLDGTKKQLSIQNQPIKLEPIAYCQKQLQTSHEEPLHLCSKSVEFDTCKSSFSGGALVCNEIQYGLTITNIHCDYEHIGITPQLTYFLRTDLFLDWISKLTIKELENNLKRPGRREMDLEYEEQEREEDSRNYAVDLEDNNYNEITEQYEDLYVYVSPPQVREKYIKGLEISEIRKQMENGVLSATSANNISYYLIFCSLILVKDMQL